jgi:isoleucyl-tRNA synthetase
LYCKNCNQAVATEETTAKIAGIFEKESSDAWVEYEADRFLPDGFKCPDCGCGNFTKESDIMDVWFDSGISHYAVVEKRSDELGHRPVEMYLEGTDQYRGWFQSSLLTSVATTGNAPYKTVLTHGFVMDSEGKKMSKSIGNVVLPQEITKVFGADVLRLWAASVDYRNDARIGDNAINQLVEIFKKIRNTSRFLLGNLYDFVPSEDYVDYENLKEIDKFALHKLNTLISDVTEAFEGYEFYKYFQNLQNFAAVDLSSFYLDIVKDRLYTAGKKSLSRRACQTVLYEISQALTRLLVPVMPFQAEDIWQNTPDSQKNGLESILLSDWAELNPVWQNDALEAEFSGILKLREIVTKSIEPLRAQKIIGSSLEAAVYVKGGDYALLKKYENELSNIFITSQAILTKTKPEDTLNEYSEDDYVIYVTKAFGEKCPRCWKYRELTNEGACRECLEAIND